jgi:hypothetical protein
MGFVGYSELQAALLRLEVKVDLVTRQIVAKAAAVVEKEAKSNFEGSHRRGEPHNGGSMPNVVSGDLRRSITATPVARTGLATYAARVGPTAVYGRRVELGWNGSAGYPYFDPAVKSSRAKFGALAASVWASI